MKKFSKYSVPVVRILLGLVFFVFGLNGFLNFIPLPTPSGVAGQFMGGLAATGYFFPLLKGTEVAVGILLLTGRFVPLALTVLAPVMLNIVAFHLFVAPEGVLVALVYAAMQLYLVIAYRDAFAGVLQANATPKSKAAARAESNPEAVPDALQGAS